MEWLKFTTTSGDLSVKINKDKKTFFLHSRYNPKKEAENLVENIKVPDDCRELIIIGMGAGYHIQELVEKFPRIKIIVLEFNYLYAKWAQEQIPLIQNLILNKDIEYIYSLDMNDIKNFLNNYISKKYVEFYVFKQVLELINDESVKLWLRQIRLLKTSFENQRDKMEQNFYLNVKQNFHGLTEFQNLYINKPFILVSAGPSLTKQLPMVKKAADSRKMVIVSVGTSFELLLKNDISPNLVIISDANDEIMNQFNLNQENDIPLFFLSTANHGAVMKYKGPKYILWQKGFARAENYAKLKEEPLINTGGSVATSLLDLSVKLGAKSIALVGQDLAFTNNQTHAKGIDSNKTVLITESLIKIDDFYRENKIYTPLNLYTYKKWFENYALSIKNFVELWNCTEGGAYLENYIHGPLKTFVTNNLEKNSL